MQTKPLDALRLWWREINYSSSQRKALLIVAISVISFSALFIFKPHTSQNSNQLIQSQNIPAIVQPPMIFVDVAGEVIHPGVFQLPPNSRVIDAIKAAGGQSKFADLTTINLARVIKDGEQIYVDRKFPVSSGIRNGSTRTNSIININRASAKELESLPGIGPVLAARIIEYRKSNGSFTSIDDLKKVPGVGGAKLAKFKEKIRV